MIRKTYRNYRKILISKTTVAVSPISLRARSHTAIAIMKAKVILQVIAKLWVTKPFCDCDRDDLRNCNVNSSM